MKIHKTIQLFLVLSILGTANALAEDGSIHTDKYGIVDAVSAEESRMVINDISIIFNRESSFFKANGDIISNIKRSLPKGTPVVYQTFKKGSLLILRALKIISTQEYKNSKRNSLRISR